MASILARLQDFASRPVFIGHRCATLAKPNWKQTIAKCARKNSEVRLKRGGALRREIETTSAARSQGHSYQPPAQDASQTRFSSIAQGGLCPQFPFPAYPETKVRRTHPADLRNSGSRSALPARYATRTYGRPTGVGVWFDVGVAFGLLLLPIFLAHCGLQTVTVALGVLTGMPLPFTSLLQAGHFMTNLHRSFCGPPNALWNAHCALLTGLSTTPASRLKRRSCMSRVPQRAV